MNLTFEDEIEILKFLANHPFKELLFKDDDVCQIVGVNYASCEVKLRDFVDYSVEEILTYIKGFKDENIDKQWCELMDKILNY